jgi:glycosyltransferase involved in cell wall biosynthesis
MKICVSVNGVFHACHLAAQLHRHDALSALVTTYPARWIERSVPVDLPRSRIRSNGLHAVSAGLARVRLNTPLVRIALGGLHDRFAAAHVREDLDIFAGWSGSSLRALRRANRLGVTSVLVRGSSHILEQIELLKQEYARYGLAFDVHPALVDNQLAEYEEADYVQTNSTFARDTLIARGIDADRILTTNTGVDLQIFRSLPKNDDTFRVIYAGNLGIRKGSPYLLQAWRDLALPNAELWHLGGVSPEMHPLLKDCGNQGIRLLGYQPVSELHRYYAQGSVFVFPSLEEGLAVVQAQAMACGLPLICTTHSGGADLLSGDGVEGFVVPIRDAEALVEKIGFLYENPDVRAQMGDAARRRVSESFTWNDYGDRMVAIYRGLLESKASAAQSTSRLNRR